MGSTSAAVVKNAYKRYGGGPPVLKNLNMNIPSNQIYGLLGSSGCGKTTLLKVLIGALDLDYGRIQLIVSSRKQIGFMPQETSLFEEFTIGETFRFYASLYQIPEDRFQSKMEELKEILDLPSDKQQCNTLSGGQARRVSIAVTLLHSPALVILDEPTSGLDPLLANLFWRYLKELSVKGQSIVITTHYIEEARQANIVGLMRQGVLLVEDSPEKLISLYDVTSLEDVFLCLCNLQNERVEPEVEKKIEFKKLFEEESKDYSMFVPHVKAIFYKNMKWVQRNWVMFVTISFVISAICIFECNELLKYFPEMRIGIVNSGPNLCTNNYNLDRYTCLENDTAVDLSCQFISNWEKHKPDMPLVMYDTIESALVDGKKRKLVSILEIPSNFTDGILKRFAEGWTVDKNLIDSGSIGVRLDSTDFMATYKLEQDIRDVFGSLFKDLLLACGYNAEVGKLPPMKINKELFLGENIKHDPYDYTVHICLSIMCGITYVCPLLLFTITLCFEKVSGAYTRSLIGGVTIPEIFTAFALCIMLFNIINVLNMSFFQFYVYEKPCGNFLLFFILLNYLGWAGIGFGFAVILASTNIHESAAATIAISVTLYVFTGFIWPIEAAKLHIIPYISSIAIPNTLVLKSVLAIVWKDASFMNKQVLYGFGICTVHIIFYLIVIALVIKIRKTM